MMPDTLSPEVGNSDSVYEIEYTALLEILVVEHDVELIFLGLGFTSRWQATSFLNWLSSRELMKFVGSFILT